MIAILAVNAGIITFVLKAQSKAQKKAEAGQVTISQSSLSKLGVNRTPIGDSGVELVVNPNAKFGGNVTIAGNTTVGGQLTLNSTFSATSASLAQLKAGNTSLNSLTVNSDTTLSKIAIKGDMQVSGITHLQGPVTLSQLLTVNNNVNVAGSLSVGGTLAVNGFHASSVTADSSITIGGHMITRGYVPGLSRGSGLGSTDSVSVSGNDAAGTIAVNASAGGISCPSGCTLANLSFRNNYSNIPHVVVTSVGPVVGGSAYVFRTTTGFSLGITGSLSVGGHAFDYIVEQ